MTEVHFTVLGRVAVSIDGAETPVRGRRERAILAILLAARRQAVSADRLLSDVWGESPPDSAPSSLQVAVSHLRGIVEPDRAPRATAQVLVSVGAGYALLPRPGAVDAERFSGIVEEAHAALVGDEPERAVGLCEDADRLWSGVPFGEIVDSGLVHAEVTRLRDLHLFLREVHAQAQIDLGRQGLVTGELEALVTTYPFRERLWELYALGLYRAGRQADSLSALRRARTVLVDELGVDPSPALQRLEANVLAQAPDLDQSVRAQAPRSGAEPRAQEQSRRVTDAERPPMVGRADTLAVLTESLERAVRGSGSTVVVSGDPGIGKTRLVTELAARAETIGAHVLWGRCHEADVAPAYWPWVPVLRAVSTANVPPEAAELLSPSGASPAAGDAGSAALRTYDAATRMLRNASAEAPLLVVLEDLHWADTSSLQLLAYAAEALLADRVLMVVTVRATEAPSAALQRCLGALGRLAAVRLSLAGLEQTHVRQLLRTSTHSLVDDELTAVVAARTDGNPFFVIELARLLASQDKLDATGARDVDVPRGLQDVLRLRLARLPEEVRRLLGVAAVVGRDFDLDLVAEVSQTDPDTALDLLDAAVASHAVEERDRLGCYRFTHALVRETLAAGLSRVRRGRLHAAIARALEPRLADSPDLVADVAHHFVLGAAAHPELAASAVQHAVSAAFQAERRGAMDEALLHWEQALSADELMPVTDTRRRYDVLLGLGIARYRRGDIAGSRAALDAAVECGRALDDIELVAGAATSFRGAGVWHWREFGTSDPAMVKVLEECRKVLPPGRLRARVLSSLAMELTYEWRSIEAETEARRALDAARAVDDDDLFVDVVGMAALTLWGRAGAADERVALGDEALTRPLSHEQELYTRFGVAAANLQRGDSVAAHRQMTRCIELARRLRHTGADVPIAWWRFYRAVDIGDAETAPGLLEVALARHRRSSVVAVGEMEPMARLRLQGPGAPVLESDVALAAGHANPALRAMLAHALCESGRVQEAVAVLGEPVPAGAWDYASVYGDCMRVDVLAAAGLTEQLSGALARITPWGNEFAIFGSTDCAGSIDYFVGRGLEGLGDLQAAREAYQRAARRNRDADILPWYQRAEAALRSLDVTDLPVRRRASR